MAEASNRKKNTGAQPDRFDCLLQLKSQVGRHGFYRVLRSSKIIRVLKIHCKEHSLEYPTMKFFYNGVRINVTKTVAELGLVDGDEIDVGDEAYERTRTTEAQSDHESDHEDHVIYDHVIYLHLKNQDIHDGFYRFSHDKPIKCLFKQYSKDCSSEYSTLRFLRNGEVIKATKTPIELGLEDGDVIDVMENQDGEVID